MTPVSPKRPHSLAFGVVALVAAAALVMNTTPTKGPEVHESFEAFWDRPCFVEYGYPIAFIVQRGRCDLNSNKIKDDSEKYVVNWPGVQVDVAAWFMVLATLLTVELFVIRRQSARAQQVD